MEVTPALKEYAESKVANAIHNFAGIVREASQAGHVAVVWLGGPLL